RRTDRAGDHGLLRHRLPDRIDRLCCRHHWRHGQLSTRGGGRDLRRAAAVVRGVLEQQLSAGGGVPDADPDPAATLAACPRRGGRRVTRRTAALIGWAIAILLLLVPLSPLIPEFWVTLLILIGLASLTALGLVVLTGMGGMTSFGQAAFV